MSQETIKWYAKITEVDGKLRVSKAPLTEHNAGWLERMGYKPYRGVEAVRYPARRTIEIRPVEINGEVLSARVYANQCEADYINIREDYLRRVREERGYTINSPETYFYSSVPRWAQDAKDYVAFRDAVMVYSLDIINSIRSGASGPTFAEYEAGFPVVQWTSE